MTAILPSPNDTVRDALDTRKEYSSFLTSLMPIKVAAPQLCTHHSQPVSVLLMLRAYQSKATKVPKQNKQLARVVNKEVWMSNPELHKVSDWILSQNTSYVHKPRATIA